MNKRLLFSLRNLLSCFVLSIILTMCLGCQKNNGTSEDLTGSALISGKLDTTLNSIIVIRDEKSEIHVPISPEGEFSASVKPGKYSILLQTSDGKLSLVKSEVVVEDKLTISKLNAQLVPIPRITSVSAPQIFYQSAVIEWDTDIESDGRVDYGFDSLYGQSTFTDTELKTFHRIQLYGLIPGKIYHYRVVASRHSLDSTLNYSGDFQFETRFLENSQ
ncbi:MAG: hypothetical protein HQM08_19620 [Candidatus Riflebacteria bacterium]|nr:hypothetical protein [Candidatus Riflebacteria bacterium]